MLPDFIVPQLAVIFSFWNLFGLSVALLYSYWWRRPHPKFPPGPRGLPLLGVVPFFGKAPGLAMKKWSVEKYGPVMSVRFGREEVVVLNTFDAINLALVKRSASFSDRPWVQLFCSQTNQRGIVFRKYGETFKVQKHFTLKYLREKGVAKRKIENMLNEEGDHFVAFLNTINDGPIDLKKYLFWVTGNVIFQTVLGKRNEYGDENLAKLLTAISNLFKDPRLSVISLFPFLGRLPPLSKTVNRFEENMKYILDTIQTYIDEHRKNFDPNNVDDFIDAFLYEQKFGTRKDIDYTDDQLKAACRDFFVAGTETSSTTLCWCFVLLMNYPEYEKIILKEIDQTLGFDGVPSHTKKDEMPMTCAFIQESMRLKTVAPLGVRHMVNSTCELMEHIIPKGTAIIVNLSGAHMDPVDWPNPKVFNPRRFIDDNGKFVPSKKLIPFSVGTRFCLGESLARAQIFIFFVKILQKFRVTPANGMPPDINDEIVSTVTAARTCDVMLKPRN